MLHWTLSFRMGVFAETGEFLMSALTFRETILNQFCRNLEKILELQW